ncbi:MAG TPA: hypothetical protein VLE27_02925 [Thermoanaerobaculia bacterium]|nr:hypothetical protein [Thermoanaerobaculia bacterium]
MPELTPQSTPSPLNPSGLPPFTGQPKTFDPPPPLTDWENTPVFRSTFLYHFTQEGDRETLESLGRMLYDMVLEASKTWPGWIETPTRTELRAVAADVRHASLFLASVVKERRTVSLQAEDERLTFMVENYIRDLETVARGIETFLGPVQVNER